MKVIILVISHCTSTTLKSLFHSCKLLCFRRKY